MTEHTMDPEAARQFLRHTVATLAYRAEKVLRDVPEGYAGSRATPTTRTPLEVVSHLGDLMEWAESMARGDNRWQPVPSTTWSAAVERFFRGLAALDAALAQSLPQKYPPEIIFQGPIADALTHVGQLSMMRGMVGSAVRPESYARAEIRVGRVGPEQSATRKEFDGDASQPRQDKSARGGSR
jgi:hypothetical protein